MNGDSQNGDGQNQGRQSWDDLYQNYVQPNLPAGTQAYLQGRPKLQRQQAKGYFKNQTFPRQVGRMQSVRQMGGYGQASTAQQEATLGDLASYQSGGSPVNFRRAGVDYETGGTPMLAQLSQYTRERL